MPNVVPVLGGVVGPAAEDPHAVAIDDGGEPDPRGPWGAAGDLFPLHAIAGRPDVVTSLVLRHIVSAAEDPDLVVVNDGGVIGARRPAGAGGLALPFLAVGRRPDVVF